MATWLHRTTKRYMVSTSESSLPEAAANYIENPDVSAVAGQPTKYWVITGDVVTLMDQTAMDAVDAALLTAARDAVAAELDDLENILRAFMLIVLDEINVLRVDNGRAERTAVQLKSAIRGRLGS